MIEKLCKNCVHWNKELTWTDQNSQLREAVCHELSYGSKYAWIEVFGDCESYSLYTREDFWCKEFKENK